MSMFSALQARENASGTFEQVIVERDIADLPAGELLIRVKYSSLNYKDALSASGNRGVTKQFPHTPGIDAAGVVESSSVAEFSAGDEVIVTGYDLGMNTAGGFAQYIRVPASWAIKRPKGLSLREAMVLGTAGLTAALCVDKLEQAGVTADAGPILVTGATGGVGCVAVALLAKLGFSVAASTGKADRSEWLQRLGATQIVLRGANLLGVDSVELPLVVKASMWDKLSVQWKLPALDRLTHEIGLEQLPEAIAQILAGKSVGRVLVRVD